MPVIPALQLPASHWTNVSIDTLVWQGQKPVESAGFARAECGWRQGSAYAKANSPFVSGQQAQTIDDTIRLGAI